MLANLAVAGYIICVFCIIFCGSSVKNKCKKKEAHRTFNHLLDAIHYSKDHIELVLLSFAASDFINDYKKHIPHQLLCRFRSELNAAIKNKQTVYAN